MPDLLCGKRNTDHQSERRTRLSHRKPNVSDCVLCKRELPLTFHHVIPKLVQKRRWVKELHTATQLQEGIWVCKPCHSAIHRFIEHADLAREYHTVGRLLSHEELGKFVRWSQKQRRPKKVRRKRNG